MGVACARPLTARRGRSPGPSPCPAHVGLTGECQNPVECFKGVSLANTNDAALRGGRQSVGVLGVVNIYTYRRHTGPVSCIYPHGLLPSSCACCFLPPSSHAAWSDGHSAPPTHGGGLGPLPSPYQSYSRPALPSSPAAGTVGGDTPAPGRPSHLTPQRPTSSRLLLLYLGIFTDLLGNVNKGASSQRKENT